MKIYKYQPDSDGTITLQPGYKILSVQLQANEPTIWAAIDPNVKGIVKVRFWVAPTGGDIDKHDLDSYVTTLIGENGLVWHIFIGESDV